MLHDLYSVLLAAAKIHGSARYPRRLAVWLAYVRIRATHRWLKITGRQKTSEHFLGFTMHFFN